MPHKDLHDKPFDQTTKAKLEIFEDYAQAWLPTFVMRGDEAVCVFDFFAGTGYDKNGVEGSPIRILKTIKSQIQHIFQKKVKVKVFLNEWEPKKQQNKFASLQESCNEYLNAYPEVRRAIELNLYNEDFEVLFPKFLPTIKLYPSLVYLDQNGIKFLSDKYFLELEKAPQTDFLYFVSASYFWRFGNSEEFKMHLDIDIEAAKKDPYKFIHRNVIDQLKKRLPKASTLRLYPFSLKKGANIHGIVFGASHPRAVDKFLSIAWKRNTVNGEANFDIDGDRAKAQVLLFEEAKPTKIDKFKEGLRIEILNGRLRNNLEVLNFAYESGHIGTHAAECLKEMKRNKEIDFEGVSPLITYENVYKINRRVEYKIIKDGTIKH